MKPKFIFLLILFFQGSFISISFSQSLISTDSIAPQDTSKSLFENFSRNGVLDLVLTTDFKSLVKQKKKETYQPAYLAYYDQDSAKVTIEAKIRARGNSRKRICSIPPIKIKVKKEHLKAQGFQPYKTLKLVAPCKKPTSYEQLILKEYLIYQLYNILTEYSFKTQLVRLRYVDTSQKLKPRTKYAFLIEHEDEMANRLNAHVIHNNKCHPDKLKRDQACLMYLFQFMIGNTDWKVHNLHNVKALYQKGITKFFPVAYDFDYAGIIDAPYAVPHEKVPIKNVRERYYHGECQTKEELEDLFKIFIDKKEDFFQCIQQMEWLTKRNKSNMVQYLEDFYKIIESKKRGKRFFSNKCP